MSQPSPGLALAWRIAASEAGVTGHSKIECAHLLMGLLSLDKANAKALVELKIDPEHLGRIKAELSAVNGVFAGTSVAPAALRRDLRSRMARGGAKAKGLMSRSAEAKAAFAQAEALAKGVELNSLHVLSVLLQGADAAIAALLAERRVGKDLAKKAASASAGPFLSKEPAAPARRAVKKRAAPEARKTGESTLDRFGRDLTALASRGAIGPIFGRQKEIAAVLQILAKAGASHPLLVGEVGVGKSAIVEALALKGAASNDVPGLSGQRIVELDLRKLMTGTEIRGELEKRTRSLVEELKALGNVILFIDEIHVIVGAGHTGSVLEAGNLLKPALARGDIRVIGATTVKDFRASMERAPGLSERFEPIDVPEPSLDQTMDILRGLKARLEKQHGVRIADEAIEAAASLSVRFDPDRRLPNKAVDLIGRAAARSQVPTAAAQKKQDAAGEGFVGAMVDARAVAEVLAEKRGLPIETVTDGAGSGARLLKLEAHLRSKIVGQDEAVSRVAALINLAYAGISSRESPLAVCLLLGPSGVGKTELARSLARFLFDQPDALTVFEMGDFKEKDSVCLLVGSPPGAGPETQAQLVDVIRRRPHSVVVFDGVEQAHPDVLAVIHQLCDTGRVADGHGRVADARQVVVVMTSNAGFGSSKRSSSGFDSGETVPLSRDAQRKAKVRKVLGADLLSRIDEVITLRPLDESDARRLLRPAMARLVTTVRKTYGVLLRIEPAVETFVLRAGFDAERGVRELHATIQSLVEDPLARLAASGKLSKHPSWKATVAQDSLSFVPELTRFG